MAATKKQTAEKAPGKKAPGKKAPGKKAPAKKNAAEKAPAKKTAPAKKAPAKKAPAKKAPAKKSAPAEKTPAKKTPAKKTPAKKTPAKKTPVKNTPPRTTPPKKGSTTNVSASPPTVPASGHFELPAPRGVTKDGISYTKDFDVKFLKAQRDALEAERARLLGQAVRLEDEANSLIEEGEMGDVQFDDEGGEGDTMVVERERDLALSSQARQTIVDIDEAIARIEAGTYGYSTTSGRPIPRERLEAIPWATELVSEKVGGIGRR